MFEGVARDMFEGECLSWIVCGSDSLNQSCDAQEDKMNTWKG
jgi:hypothetical protein